MARKTIKELEDKIEELELKIKLQKLHCKLFHKQKFSIWIKGRYYLLRFTLNDFFKK